MLISKLIGLLQKINMLLILDIKIDWSVDEIFCLNLFLFTIIMALKIKNKDQDLEVAIDIIMIYSR